jgi:hypothetical protein
MSKYLTHSYVIVLWFLCGEALDTMFEAWWPTQRGFWSSAWTGGLVIALLAAVIISPAAVALEAKQRKT